MTKQLSVTYACGAQDYWDLEPDGSLHIDIPQAQVVVAEYEANQIAALREGTHPMTSNDTFAHYLATKNIDDPRTPEQKQWDQVAADLITARLNIVMHMDQEGHEYLITAITSIEHAMDTLDTLSPAGKDLMQ